MNFYNDIDPKACAWLSALISAGEIPPGHVDERSITEIDPDELRTYTQCHFFAGIGGWSYALRLARWDHARPVWTASLPCQPFSAAGDQKGGGDDRNLWPYFYRLVTHCQPERILGEQVEAAIGFGWLDRVFSDMEAQGYACGAAVLGAHSVGAPHKRNRIYWVANSTSGREAMDEGRCEKPRGPGKNVCAFSWPDHAGSSSAITVPEILSKSHGIPGRVGLLRGYGNAIVPQVAAAFIEACEDVLEEA